MTRTTSLTMALTSITCLMMLVTARASAQECGEYEVTAIVTMDECPPYGIPPVVPWGINEQGWMVGYFKPCVIGAARAWLWTPDDGLVVIAMPVGTSESRALAISGSKIVGRHFVSGDEFGAQAFIYDHSTNEFTDLGTLPGGNWSEARDINSSGQIAGFWGNNITGPWQAFIWQNGKMIDLGASIGGANNRALGINENGAITGWRREDGGEKIAFIWEDGKAASLGPIPDGFSSTGFAINQLGYIAGDGKIVLGDNKTTVVQSFLWAENQMINLGTLPGTTFTRARGINDRTQIVGYCHNQLLIDQAAFIWHEGKMTDLNDLILPSENLDLQRAMGINEAGQIACGAVDQFNNDVAVLLTPIVGAPGDLDGNCQVTTADLLLLLSNWGPCDGCPADLDGNGIVSTSDLLILLSNWG